MKSVTDQLVDSANQAAERLLASGYRRVGPATLAIMATKMPGLRTLPEHWADEGYETVVDQSDAENWKLVSVQRK